MRTSATWWLQKLSPAIVAAVFAAAPAFVCALSWGVLPPPKPLIIQVASSASSNAALENGDTDVLASGAFGRLRSMHLASDTVATVLGIVGILLAIAPWHAAAGAAAYFGVAALSPVSAALYKVLFARVFGRRPASCVALVLATLCVVNLTFGLVLLVSVWALLRGTGKYDAAAFLLPTSLSLLPAGWLILSAAASVAFNWVVNYGVTIMPPLYVSIGTLLATALNIVVDLAFLHEYPSAEAFAGIVLIALALFVLIGTSLKFPLLR